MTPPFGKRFSFKAAAAYLDVSDARLRRLVRFKQIAYSRTSGETHQRVRHAGRLEFFQSDLDAYLQAHRQPVAASTTPMPSSHHVDRDVDALIQKLDART